MNRIANRKLAAALAVIATFGCTPLTAFDALVPKDSGVMLAVDGASYGSDPRQRIDVYRPRSAAMKPLPVIIFFYGGSWSSGTRKGYSFVGRALASRGFVVAIPDYRLVPNVRYPAFVEDSAEAVRWVIGHAGQLGGDPDRLVIAGHSAGAYNGAMLAYDRRWLGRERGRVRGFIGLAGPYDFLPLADPATRAAFLGTTDLGSTQPVNLVTAGAPPAFLATGAEDTVVRPRNSDALAARLRAVGTLVVRRRYANVGHVGLLTAISRPLRNRASVLEDLTAFAEEVTGSEEQTSTRARRSAG